MLTSGVWSDIYGCSWQINCAQHSTLGRDAAELGSALTKQSLFLLFFSLASGFVKMSAAVEPLDKLGRSSLKGEQPRVEWKGENVF